MKIRNLMIMGIITCIILSGIQLSPVSAKHSSQNFNIKGMLRCNISIEGRGYSSWLNGFTINGKAFVSVAIIYIKDGVTTTASVKNPNEKYTFTGKQLIFMIGYAGEYYSSNEYIPYLIYNGTTTTAIVTGM